MHRRRRFLRVLAASAGLALLPGSDPAVARLRHRWRGSALGASARIDLWAEERQRAEGLVRACVAEIDRLERIFSLHRADSALSALNQAGRLSRPPLELVSVLEAAARIARLSGSAFDVTVQPLWRFYADHFARRGPNAAGPEPGALERVRPLVGHAAVEVEPGAIRLARPGMALTLNGIAQGFIADRIATLLQDSGMASAFLDVGEVRAVGSAPDGQAWPMSRPAAATSSPAALTFDGAGRLPHLLDPATLRPCRGAGEVTVEAESAMIADALSTALAIRPDCLPPSLQDRVAVTRKQQAQGPRTAREVWNAG